MPHLGFYHFQQMMHGLRKIKFVEKYVIFAEMSMLQKRKLMQDATQSYTFQKALRYICVTA
jgi:hypothetical protein